MPTIVAAKTEKHMEDFRILVREFAAWAMTQFHPDQTAPPAVVAKLEQELVDLPGKYSVPEGALFIAYLDDDVAGCVAGFKSERGAFEVTRLWVRSECRGKGVGDKLVEALLSAASHAGYKSAVLRSHKEMASAHKVYRRMGFVEVVGNTHFSNFEGIEIAMQCELN
jgi:ribosomal protein S18 acetylase RimI-like enzyme